MTADRNADTDMASGCSLGVAGLGAQLGRYRELHQHASSVQRVRGELRVRFDDEVPLGLLAHTLDVERRCCPFIHASYDDGERLLILTVENVNQAITLDSLFAALS